MPDKLKKIFTLFNEVDVSTMGLGKSLEDYLEAILILKRRTGDVRSVDVARYMGFSKPSVSIAMKELRTHDYITVAEDGGLILTDSGFEIASQVYERHKSFTDYLISIGVDPEVAEKDACQMEHVISEESFAKLKENLGKR